uniref:sensor histidine kinase n=1 Tax=Sporofaciens musculi TaxID=2681861 RepID=UPI0025912299
GGKITISCERTPAMIRIFITDNGHGIAGEDIHHIFKRFYRSKNTSDSQGIGLGLPLAKAIVEGQGGILSVQSERLQGTTFTLSFLT